MKLLQREFRLSDMGGWKGGDLRLCSRAIGELFDLPEAVTTLWLSLHDRPSANRYQMKVVEGELGVDLVGMPPISDYEYGDDPLDRFLRPLVGRKVYLQTEYV